MIPTIVVIAAALAGIAFVVIPLRRGPRWFPGVSSTATHEAEERKSVALAGIVDLEQELEIGKLSRDDFEILRGEYERDAIAALHELDSDVASEEDALEKEIAAARARLACPSCGAPRAAAGPCPRCGS